MRMKKGRRKRKIKVGRIIIALIIVIILIVGFVFLTKGVKNAVSLETKYIANDNYTVDVFSYNTEENSLTKDTTIVRGSKVSVNVSDKITKDNIDYVKIKFDDKEYYVDATKLVDDKNKVVLEDTIYVRTPATLISDLDKSTISGFASKASSLEVVGYDNVDSEGKVTTYKVKNGDSEAYIYGKYVVFSEEEAKANYEASKYDPIHSQIKNTYNGGEAINLDFYPNEKPSFEDNKMPSNVYSLYLNAGVLGNVDAYIEYAKTTKINTFVVDIVDDTAIGYESDVMKEISPTSYANAINSVDKYKEAIDKLKNAGFYVIGRITAFKDSYYVKDHEEDAISKNGSPFLHNNAYWPSAYSRDVWYYKVALAKEAVKLFGFNEINYDYVRFPDRMTSIENSVDLQNEYDEDKTQAIQRFVQYATDELHKLGVYVSIDVFGESTNGSYTTAYGQYWPAISNVCDAISGMPYPDHFAANSYGISEPWNNPYDLMYNWASDAVKRQSECPTPAVIRTWVQAYDVMSHVDPNGISYNGDNVKKEIEGLYDAGATGGYITWNSASSLEKYKLQKSAFDIDYGEVYNSDNS